MKIRFLVISGTLRRFRRKKRRRRIRREARITEVLDGYTSSIAHLDCVATSVLLRGEIQIVEVVGEVVGRRKIKIPKGVSSRSLSCVIDRERPRSLHLICMIKPIPALQSYMADLVTNLTSRLVR